MLTFKHFATEHEAREFCASMDRRSKASYTPWQSSDENDPMHFIAWYETTPQKVTYEIRQIDAWMYDDNWTYNETWNIGTFKTAGDPARAFRRALAHMGITFYRGRTSTVYDDDIYEICDRKTGEPLFAAIPTA